MRHPVWLVGIMGCQLEEHGDLAIPTLPSRPPVLRMVMLNLKPICHPRTLMLALVAAHSQPVQIRAPRIIKEPKSDLPYPSDKGRLVLRVRV